MKKTAFILSLLLLLSTFASCGKTTDEPENGTAQEDVPVQETEPAEEPDPYDVGWQNLPDTKYDGRTFNVLTRDDLGGTGDSGMYEIVANEEKLAEQTNEAVYNRNMLIEQEFGVKITAEGPGNWDAVTSNLENSVMAQDHNYTLVSPVEFKVYAVVSKGLVGNWLDVPVVNLDAPWWNARSNKQSTINGKLFAACSDLSVTSVMNSYGIFFNADLADQYGIATETLQNAVFDGKWTIDYLTSLIANIYVDNNGDGVKDDQDTYGFVSPTVNPTDAWPTSFDIPLCEVDSSGSLTVTMFNDKMLSALDKIISLYDGQVGSLKMKDHLENMRRDARVNNMFLTDKAVFIPVYLDAARSAFADMESDYGMLPYPKYDEAQTNYYTHSRDSISFFAYPVTTPESDYEFLGTIMEALNIESGRTVHTAFYDNALKGRYSMDSNTAKIVDIIMDGITFDFSFQYGESHLFIPYMFRNCVTNGVNTLMTDYAAQRQQIESGIEAVMSFYKNN